MTYRDVPRAKYCSCSLIVTHTDTHRDVAGNMTDASKTISARNILISMSLTISLFSCSLSFYTRSYGESRASVYSDLIHTSSL